MQPYICDVHELFAANYALLAKNRSQRIIRCMKSMKFVVPLYRAQRVTNQYVYTDIIGNVFSFIEMAFEIACNFALTPGSLL